MHTVLSDVSKNTHTYTYICGLFVTGKSILPVTTCKRDSDHYSTCLKRAIEEAWPKFIAGLPEFDFPPLDPLIYDYGKVLLRSGEIRGELIVSNLTATGLSKARFLDVTTHFLDDVFRLKIDVLVPKLFIKGAVTLDGTLNVFRLASKGLFNVTLEDVRQLWDFSGHVVNDTWILEHFHIAPSFGKFKVSYESLIEEDKQFNDIVVSFINEFWPAIYRVVLPFLSNIWDPYLFNIANEIFLNVSFSEIFP
ncbi:PREDICTED: uncharacterized protein LOC105567831 [Vollenhovia emeryi]|uniref:uncharacterized protein LOC105567831 n=1 Tax=Vollenhovia emeryi TaxID=411798 RepID=UPI0005F4CF5A|nr:PREDICTED: uncharacterized protein LOC105567831 [Vollenhovia emeryi]